MALFLEPVEMLEPKRPGRPRVAIRQHGVERVMAMVELRDHMRGGPVARAAQVAKRETWQETKTKATAFALFVLATAVLVYVMYAGVKG